MASLGEKIRQIRLKNNMTQEEFGKLIGAAKSTVSLYESDHSVPLDEIKKKISIAFNVSLDFLMGLSDIETPNTSEEHKSNAETKAYHVIDISELTDEAVKQVEDYVEFMKLKHMRVRDPGNKWFIAFDYYNQHFLLFITTTVILSIHK